ncbi:MAG TPA: nucleotidyltransferase family protein [Bacteroidales bacterium]|nr:nucleotidyltransferase family protein [Bacteroidales bacterium]
MRTTEAIILAGGMGKRLQPVVAGIPKPMAPVNGKPFLSYLIAYVRQWGITRIILSVGHKYQEILSFFGEKHQDADLFYSIEEEPLGTGGGILRAMEHVLTDEVLVLNGDTMYRIGLDAFEDFHRSRDSMLSIALRFQERTGRYGLVETDLQHRITGFTEKPDRSGGGWINGGIYLINTAFYRKNSHAERFSFETDLLPGCLPTGRLYGYQTGGYFIDIGTPESYLRAQHELKGSEY